MFWLMHKLFQVEYNGENWYLRAPPSFFSMIMKLSPRSGAYDWPDIKHCQLRGLYFFNTTYFLFIMLRVVVLLTHFCHVSFLFAYKDYFINLFLV